MIDDKEPSYPNSDLDITDPIIDDGTTAIDGIDSLDPIADIKDEENSDPDLEKIEEEATESTASGSGGGVPVFYAPESSTDNTVYKLFSTKTTNITNESIVLDFYVDLNAARNAAPGFNQLTGYKLTVNTKNGWSTDTEAMSGSTAFSWTNSIALTDGSATTGAISINNALSNSSVGNIVLVSGADISAGVNEVKIGTMTINPVDDMSAFAITVSGSLTDINSQLASQAQTSLEVF